MSSWDGLKVVVVVPQRELSVINVVFDGPPTHEGPRFVEVEDDSGHSIRVGEWVDRGDGYWALRIECQVKVNSEGGTGREQ